MNKNSLFCLLPSVQKGAQSKPLALANQNKNFPVAGGAGKPLFVFKWWLFAHNSEPEMREDM
jgi:hypothetical protein